MDAVRVVPAVHGGRGADRPDRAPRRRTGSRRSPGVEREFDAEITEQHPDERVAWTTENGTHQSGVVTFHRIGDDTTRVTLQLDHDPQGFVEKAGDALGIVQRRIKGDLANFKKFIEARGAEEGGWRGDVDAAPQTGHLTARPAPPTGCHRTDPRTAARLSGRRCPASRRRCGVTASVVAVRLVRSSRRSDRQRQHEPQRDQHDPDGAGDRDRERPRPIAMSSTSSTAPTSVRVSADQPGDEEALPDAHHGRLDPAAEEDAVYGGRRDEQAGGEGGQQQGDDVGPPLQVVDPAEPLGERQRQQEREQDLDARSARRAAPAASRPCCGRRAPAGVSPRRSRCAAPAGPDRPGRVIAALLRHAGPRRPP